MRDLDATDLQALRSTSEGWYVEYKQEVPNASSIAKSVSAFANHYGGWLFYGIAQSQSGQNFAESFPGIGRAELADNLKRITDAVAGSISPAPYFDSRIIWGPDAGIGLPADRCVIVLCVTEGSNPPYVHSSGRIYRRIADKSDPKEETDRSALDLLWAKGAKARARLSKALKRRPEFSLGERESPYMRLFVIADPLNDRSKPSDLIFTDFARVMRDATRKWSMGISFENAFASSNGFVARHVYDNDPQRLVFTCEHSLFGTTTITAPMFEARINKGGQYLHFLEFLTLSKSMATGAKILDLSLLFLLLGFCIGKHWELARAGGVEGPFYAKARFFNIWRRRPYLDTTGFLDFVRSHGVPVIQETDVFSPPGATFESLLILPDEKLAPDEPDPLPDLRAASGLMANVCAALGLPVEVVQASAEEMVEAANRARMVHGTSSPKP
jgi:hypothetical protein